MRAGRRVAVGDGEEGGVVKLLSFMFMHHGGTKGTKL